MLTKTPINDIIGSPIKEADFLCQNTPLVCERKHTVFLIGRRGRGSLLEGIVQDKPGRFQKGHIGYWKNKRFSKEHRYKISIGSKKKKSLVHCENIKKAKVGKNNPRWKGGRTTHGQGYILVRFPKKRVFEHRLIMEKVLGRSLKKDEMIHHRNGIKDDNRIENLEIVLRKSHFGKVVCPYCEKEFLIK